MSVGTPSLAAGGSGVSGRVALPLQAVRLGRSELHAEADAHGPRARSGAYIVSAVKCNIQTIRFIGLCT